MADTDHSKHGDDTKTRFESSFFFLGHWMCFVFGKGCPCAGQRGSQGVDNCMLTRLLDGNPCFVYVGVAVERISEVLCVFLLGLGHEQIKQCLINA